ncbi:MAG: hypothetical protein ACRED1_11215, partial [Limisphaerales bacterium]
AKNPKIRSYAEPFIEAPPPPRSQLQVRVHPVSRLELPPKQSVIGALFSSFIGIILILLIYAANIYAGYEIAIFRARPIGLVTGIAAVAPIAGPIIFLSMPTLVEGGATEQDMQVETGAPPGATAAPHAAPVAAAQSPAAGSDAPAQEPTQAVPAGWQAAVSLPETQVFQRGQFTFNRRFFETKFSDFFGMLRHGSAKDMVLVIKTARGQHIVERITRIAANEAHFEVVTGTARQEVLVPFGEILEIRLKHKDA